MSEMDTKHPYGMRPSDEKVSLAIVMTRRAYDSLPETTCKQRALCCNAGCPNMHYAEFMSIREGAVQKMAPDQRLNLTIECIKRYLKKQKDDEGKPIQKPCVFLTDNKCSIYSVRHLKCRLYGLIPESMYKENVDLVAEEMGVPKEDIPLCSQCPFVKVTPEFENKFPNNKLPKQMIRDLEKTLRDVDRVVIGMPPGIQQDGFGYLTYHDWHLLFELGEEWLAKLTPLREKLSDEEKEQFVQHLKTALGTKYEGPQQ